MVSFTIHSVHLTIASLMRKWSTFKTIPVNSVPLTGQVFCVVSARNTLAWQLDLLGALNVLTALT